MRKTMRTKAGVNGTGVTIIHSKRGKNQKRNAIAKIAIVVYIIIMTNIVI